MVRRSVVAADDGVTWLFEQAGEPFEFERVDRYQATRVVDRFSREMLDEYLRALGVPLDAQPNWAEAVVVGA